MVIPRKFAKKEGGKRLSEIAITIILLVLALNIFSYLKFTGYAVLDNAEIFSGKDVYTVGETVHLFILRSNATYITVRVYEPGGDLYSESLDFMATKIGKYRVQAIFMAGDEIKELRTSFRVKPLDVKNETINVTGENITANITANLTENITEIIENASIINVTVNKIEPSNLTFITVFTDKDSYAINETIDVFGVLMVDGEMSDSNARLEIIFGDDVIYASWINITSGIYNHSLAADFGDEGEYIARISAAGLSSQAIFYFSWNLTAGLEEIKCKKFNETLLWSSGYSLQQKGSTTYQTWYPAYNCTSLNVSDCFIGTLNVKTRFFYFGESNEQGEGYVQISSPEGFECDKPEQGKYEKYLAYESLEGESQRLGKYCGNNKNPDAKCGAGISQGIEYAQPCYGIKTYATKNFLVDVFEIEYSLCWRENG